MAVWKIIFNFSPIQNVPFFEEFLLQDELFKNSLLF